MIPIPQSKMPNKIVFDLKVVCCLIPVMDGVEATTKRMIDSVEMHGNMIGDSGKSAFITFVIKSRLPENAKLHISGTFITPLRI